MIPDPLHPAVVHFPVVLMMLLPLFIVGALWAIRRGAAPLRAWALPAAVAVALALSSWVAVETGEAQEEKVEDVVSEKVIDGHADLAETFLALSTALLVITAAGFLRDPVGRAARIVAAAGAVALIGVGVQVGHTGGKLVYQHGAASAYAGNPAPGGGEAAGQEQGGGSRERGDRDD